MESLEQRALLSGDGLDELVGALAAAPAPAAEVAPDSEQGTEASANGAPSLPAVDAWFKVVAARRTQTGGQTLPTGDLGEDEPALGGGVASFGEGENDAPVIYDFSMVLGALGYWTVSGTVVDPDDFERGWTVVFGGILEGYSAEVEKDGYFELIEQFPNLTEGTVTAQTTDPHGADSNEATFYVNV